MLLFITEQNIINDKRMHSTDRKWSENGLPHQCFFFILRQMIKPWKLVSSLGIIEKNYQLPIAHQHGR